MKYRATSVPDPQPSPQPRHRGRRQVLEAAAYPEGFNARHCDCGYHRLEAAIKRAALLMSSTGTSFRGGVVR